MTNRRAFIKQGALATGATIAGVYGLQSCAPAATPGSTGKQVMIKPKSISSMDDMFFDISLAQWSFHKALWAKEMDTLEFAAKTRSLDMNGIEYVNQFFKDKAEDSAYLAQLNQRAADHGVKQVLIMIDREGNLGSSDDAERKQAVTNHYKWVDAAKTLGCHSIRVNAAGEGTAEEVAAASVDGLGNLSEYAAKESINIIVENHGGYSSNGSWLAGVMKQVNMDNCGTLPDFGNFCIVRDPKDPYNLPCLEAYDRYKGVTEMMPFAKAVSAKTHNFDASGDETETDYMKMMQIVKDHGYKGFVGIEYEGSSLTEEEGIIKTRDLLRKVGKALS